MRLKTRTPAEKAARSRKRRSYQAEADALPLSKKRQTARVKPLIHVYRDGRQRINTATQEGKILYRSRTLEMAERQKWLCGICGGFMCTYDVTFDHVDLRGKFRDDRIEDEAGKWLNRAAHGLCNMERGSKRVARGEAGA